MDDEVQKYIVDQFVIIRDERESEYPKITVRQLESMIRLSEALARSELTEEVSFFSLFFHVFVYLFIFFVCDRSKSNMLKKLFVYY